MNIIIWVYLGLATWPEVFAIYYLEKKEIFKPPTDRNLRNNSYFGYSITYDDLNKTLVISAPRETDIGEVYDCSIENSVCTRIDNSIVKRISLNYTHDYWFGATVKAGSKFVTICAPRYTDTYMKNRFVSNGKCYSYNANENDLKERKQITNAERFDHISHTHFYEKSMDSFGWSIDVASDNSIIVGGPGMHHGRVMFYDQPEIYKVPKILKSFSAPEFNFGFAIASGKFINYGLSYAVSSPYGTNGHGMVLFYKNSGYMDRYIEDTSQVGSMFGGVLCAAKLLGARTDLLVGAPTYATKDTYNLGAVYVYLARTLAKVPEFHRIIVSKVSGSSFGSAIISVGDLNGDKKDEIAIGAPFEKDGHGIVYLYSGADIINNDRTENLKYLQRIEAEKSYGESFGMSLAPLLDYDKNGCKELAIGSPYTDTVVLLRCMAAVIVETLKPKFPNLQIRNSSQTDFDFEICLSVKYPALPKKIEAVLSTTVEIEHDFAKLRQNNSTSFLITYETSLDKKASKYCNNVSLFLPQDGQYETKISFIISSKLLNDPSTMPNFNSSRVILSDLSVLTRRASVWAAECKGNETCVPNLTFTPYISFDHDKDPYIIGSSETETVNVIVQNIGEMAYDPCVRVHISGVNVLTIPTRCQYEGSSDPIRLLCEPSRPIRTNNTWTIGQIELEMTHLTNLDKNVTIIMFLFDHCDDVLSKNISKTIPVKAESRGISAKGETDIGSIVNMAKVDIKQNGKKFQHIYTINNKGGFNWKNLEVRVNLQIKPYIKYGTIIVYNSYSVNNYPSCLIVSQNETSMSYLCLIESLVKNIEIAKILIPTYIVPGTLNGILGKNKNVTTMSSINLKLIGNDSKYESIITTIRYQEATPVSIETLIIAVIVGICIFILIVFLLYSFGFLSRKKRDDLIKLKREVKRRTIRRSMMPSQPPQPNEQDLKEE